MDSYYIQGKGSGEFILKLFILKAIVSTDSTIRAIIERL